MKADAEQRLQILEDRESIKELRATYCFLVDDGRMEELAETCFTEDAVCDFRSPDGSMQPFVSRGRDEVRNFYTAVVPSVLRNMSHTVHNHRITVSGDSASGDCYFELTASDASTGKDVVGAGRYVDRYRRVGDGWRFEFRKAEIFYITTLAEGWTKRRFLPSLSGGAV
jgi:ketosteroid isomerase-like protein